MHFSQDTIGHHILDLWEDDKLLTDRMIHKFRQDQDWRDEWKQYEVIRARYERVHRPDLDNDTPYANLMVGMVGEFLSVLIPSIPGAKLRSVKEVDPRLPELERAVRTQLLKEAEEAANLIVDSMLFENDFRMHIVQAISEAAVYGMGAVRIDTDWAGDPTADYRLRSFLDDWRAGKLGPDEIDAFFDTMGRMRVEWVPTEQVYFEAGRKRIDKFTRRCSIIEEVNTFALAQAYPEHEEKIMMGRGQGFEELDTDDEIEAFGEPRMQDDMYVSDSVDSTQVLTTWEYVDIWYDVEGIMVPDRALAKTIISSGNVLLDKELITIDGMPIEWGGFEHEIDYASEEDEATFDDGVAEYETTRGAVRLPVIPIYVFHSLKHPYGRSMIEQMMTHEDVYNNIIAILMAYSNRGLENGKIFIAKSAMAAGESQKIQAFLKDPTRDIIEIEGSNPYGEEPDVRRMIMTHQNLVAQPPAMLINMAELILRDFQRLAGLADQAALARSRSGSGKREQLAASDRPKILPVENLSESIETIYDIAYLNYQAVYNNENFVPFLLPGGISGSIQINQEVVEPLPVQNEFGEIIAHPDLANQDNPLGLLREVKTFEVNSNRVPMKAVADGRSGLPHSPILRTNQLALWQQLGWISPTTARDEGLPVTIRERDDAEKTFANMQAQQQQLQQLGAELQNEQGATPQPTTAPDGLGGAADIESPL